MYAVKQESFLDEIEKWRKINFSFLDWSHPESWTFQEFLLYRIVLDKIIYQQMSIDCRSHMSVWSTSCNKFDDVAASLFVSLIESFREKYWKPVLPNKEETNWVKQKLYQVFWTLFPSSAPNFVLGLNRLWLLMTNSVIELKADESSGVKHHSVSRK